ncbi:hypothetical protein BBP40_004202 [Aspergillus hancockii]|nr:hypothetical protein BBP40_004202 [Aspergillus hancockii]
MAQYERHQNESQRGFVHVQCLRRIAQLRGGLPQFLNIPSALLQKYYYMANASWQVDLGSSTLFTIEAALTGCKTTTQFLSLCMRADSKGQDSALEQHSFGVISADMRNLFVDMLYLASVLNNAFAGVGPKLDCIEFHKNTILLGYRLVKLIGDNFPDMLLPLLPFCICHPVWHRIPLVPGPSALTTKGFRCGSSLHTLLFHRTEESIRDSRYLPPLRERGCGYRPPPFSQTARGDWRLLPVYGLDELQTTHLDIQVKLLALNLLSVADVREAANFVNSWAELPHIDVLVNNAGIMAVPYNKAQDGFESQLQTNHLSHFLFTNLVMRKVLVSKAPRVVTVSSGVHRVGHIRWSDYNFNDGRHYQRWLSYGQSKTANALMGLALTERLDTRGLLSFPMCPGVCYTNLSAHGIDDQASFAAGNLCCGPYANGQPVRK